MTVRRRWLSGILALVCAAAIVVAARPLWLPCVGTLLMSAGPPRQADVAVVLGGDFFGNRILKAAQLVREGYVPKVLVSGPSGQYDIYECDLAIAFAVKRGFPPEIFVRLPNQTRSTRDESRTIVPELRRMGVHRYILVTSDFHTRRAGYLFRRAGPELETIVVASPDEEFELSQWWRNREGRKNVVTEWAKTIATWFGL